MNGTDFPKTVTELEHWMKEHCYNFESYSINGNSIYEGFGIEKSGNIFVWYYTERGQQQNLEYFGSETEIVQYAYNVIKNDQWARAHLIGFSNDLSKIVQLKKELDAINIQYIYDEIPYYGNGKPAYRVFVLGCDIKKAIHLKKNYFNK